LNWRAFFLIPAVLAVVVALALGRIPESLTARSTQNPIGQVATVLRTRWALWLLGLSVLQGAVMFGFVTYLAPALEASGHSPAIAGLVVASYGLSVLICTRLFSRVARVIPAALLLAGGALMLMVGFLIAANSQNVPAILAASLLAGGAYAFMQSTFQAWFTDVVPAARGTATALFATAIFGGAALATSAAAGLADAHDYRMLFTAAAILTVPVLIGGSLSRWRYRGSDLVDETQRGNQIG
jgi:predicted MFS family arabinose efflux permease